MAKARKNVPGVSSGRLAKVSDVAFEHPSVTRRKTTARNVAIDTVVRNRVCNCDGVQGKHSKDCDFVQPDKSLPRGQSVMIQTIIYHVQPQHGDIVILAIKDAVPERQFRLFRRSLYSISNDHFEKTGICVQYLVVNAALDVHHLSKAEMLDVVHENKVIIDKDGSLIETLRLIDDDGEAP